MTNIVHPNFSEGELRNGIQWLSMQLYDADAFGERTLTFLDKFG